MSNMVRISDGIYLVRTQAGFKRALKAEFSGDYRGWKLIAARHTEGYPKSYPSVVSLSIGYRGYTFFNCNSVHVKAIKAAIADA